MRLATYRTKRHGLKPHAALYRAIAFLTRPLLGESRPLDMLALLDRGPDGLAALKSAADQFSTDHSATATIPKEVAIPVWEVELLAPITRPGRCGTFMHSSNTSRRRIRSEGREVPPAWYEIPVFYFGHAAACSVPRLRSQNLPGRKNRFRVGNRLRDRDAGARHCDGRCLRLHRGLHDHERLERGMYSGRR